MRIGEIKREAKASLKGNWGLAIGATLLSGLLMGLLMFIPIIVVIIISLVAVYSVPSVFTIIFTVIFMIAAFLAIIYLLATPLQVGLEWMFLNFVDDKKRDTDVLFKKRQEVGNLFDAFKQNYWKNVGTVALQSLILGLWGALFGTIDVVAGLIFGPTVQLIVSFITWIPLMIIILGYSLVIPILKDHPEYRAIEIMRESKRLMKGNKGKYFLLGLSFIGWYIPGVVAYVTGLMMLVFNAISQDVGVMALSGLLILIGGLYLAGISFYVMPYLRASYAAFYRDLKPLPAEEMTNDPDVQYGLN